MNINLKIKNRCLGLNHAAHNTTFDINLPRTKIAIMVMFILSANNAIASENYFNPAFLSSDLKAVADLSRFEQNHQVPGEYRVDIYLNDEYKETRNILFVSDTEDKVNKKVKPARSENEADDTGLVACMTLKDLEKFGVSSEKITKANSVSDFGVDGACTDLPSLMPGAESRFDFEKQKLKISIPQAFLENNARGYISPDNWDDGINAALLNYNLTGGNSYGENSSDNYFLSLNSGLNIGAWRIRDRANWNYSKDKDSKNNDFEHISTYINRVIAPIKSQLTIGDSNTSNDIFDSLGFRGVQLYSDDNMLPDSLKGFAPTIHGIAKGNAQVIIKQNGYTIYQSYVPPGSFVINDLYPTSSSGDLHVTIKESDGTSTNYTVPYSSVPLLQREGHFKYALTGGQYRSGNKNNTEPTFAQLTSIYGLPEGYTAYAGSQISSNYKSFAIGLGKNLGDLGALSFDITQADSILADDSHHQGQSLRFLYAKSLNELGTNFQLLGYRYSTEGFYTFDETTYKMMDGYVYDDDSGRQKYKPSYSDYYNLYYTKKGKVQVNISQQVGSMGSIYLSGSEQTYWHTDEKTTLVQLGYSSYYKGVNFGLSYNYSKSQGQQDADKVLSLNVSIPLNQLISMGGVDGSSYHGNSAFITYNSSIDSHGTTSQQAGLSGTLLDDNNLSYSISQGYSNHEYGGGNGSLSLDYQGVYGNRNINYNYSSGYKQINYGLSGGAVVHRDGLTLGQPLGDTNILVAAPGAKNVAIGNTTGIKTDWRGYAVIPYATTYRTNRVELDTTSLDEHTDIEQNIENVVPTQGALVRAEFNAKVGVRLLLTLIHNNKPVPFGAIAASDNGENTSIVGNDGVVYFSGMPLSGNINVKWGEGADKSCIINYSLPNSMLTKSISQQRIICK